MKWLHWRIRSVVPRIWAGAWRASSMVSSEPPATPAPATERNFRRLRVVTSVIRASLAVVKAAGTQRAKQREKLAFFMLRSVTCQVAPPTGVSATLAPMRRPAIALVVILLGLGPFASGLGWVLDTPRPPANASRAERLYLGLCATCHGVDGHGTWR